MRSPRETRMSLARGGMCPSTAMAPQSSRYSRADASIDACSARRAGTRRQEISRNLAVPSQEHGSDTRGFVRLASGGKTRTLEELIGDARQG